MPLRLSPTPGLSKSTTSCWSGEGAQARGHRHNEETGGVTWEQGDTYPLTGEGHLWVGGDGKLGKSLGCLCLPNVSAFQGQWKQSLSNSPSPVNAQSALGAQAQAMNPAPSPLLFPCLKLLPAQTSPHSEVSR